MFALSESEFFLKVRLLQMIFIKNEGQVTHIKFVDNGETVRAKRINYAGDA